jgi:hypothetical protein
VEGAWLKGGGGGGWRGARAIYKYVCVASRSFVSYLSDFVKEAGKRKKERHVIMRDIAFSGTMLPAD